jgi:hypothetical protein
VSRGKSATLIGPCSYRRLGRDNNSPGSDTGSNSSLNAEYVVIRNGDNVSHSISGRMSRRSAATHGDTGTLELMADRAPMNAQLGTDLGRVRPWVYKSAARLTSTAPP